MAFVPFENTAQLEARFIYDNQQCANVYHVRSFDTPDVLSMTDLAAAFVGWWDTAMQPFAPTTLSLSEVVVRSLHSENAVAISYTTGLPLVGTNAGPQLPNNVTCAVKWSTALSGRSYRGRTYHLGLVESQVTGNALVAQTRTDLSGNYNTLRTTLDTAGWTMVVASRIQNGVERAVGVGTTIINASLDPTIDSQRRRLPGRGA